MIEACVVGDNCIDCYTGEQAAWFPGGNAVNVSVHLCQAGLSTAYLGTVGNDPEGATLQAALAKAGVSLQWLEVRPGPSGKTFITLKRGERFFTGVDPGVQVPFVLDQAQLNRLASCRLVHFSGFTSWDGGADRCQPRLAAELRQLAGQTLLSLDFSDTREGWDLFTRVGRHLNYGFFSRAELDEAGIHAFMARAAAFTSGIVIVTRGARGSMASAGRNAVTQPALPVRLVDTLGAGDAFIAGFLAGIAHGQTTAEALRRGAELAARVCAHFGAWPTPSSIAVRCPDAATERSVHP